MGVSLFRRSLVTAVAVSGLMGATAFAQQKEVTIAHQDMMVPWRYAHVTGAIEKATGYKINFRKFGGGGDVIRAMASGQVQIGEAGSAPVASALSQGLPVELIWILDDIADAEALVARKGSGVKTVADLKGKKNWRTVYLDHAFPHLSGARGRQSQSERCSDFEHASA